MPDKIDIAIVGAGLGGLAAAAVLRSFGFEPVIYEQTDKFARVGAGINVSPNAVRALEPLGLSAELRRSACRPESWTNATAAGEEISVAALGGVAEERYGNPFLQMHRADLHDALWSVLRDADLRLSHRLEGLEERHGRYQLAFTGGSTAEADVVIGADGMHSRVRQLAFDHVEPTFTGRVAYRGVVPAEVAPAHPGWDFVKWWGEDRHIVTYYISAGREIYYVTSIPADDWTEESWSSRGDIEELRADMAAFSPYVRRVLEISDVTHKWALNVREPMETWHHGGIALLGDSCHPMTPYMAQGAAMAFEDAVLLGRAFDETGGDPGSSLDLYERARLARTAQVQRESGRNRFMKDGGFPDWVYGYDAWSVPLGVPSGLAPSAA